MKIRYDCTSVCCERAFRLLTKKLASKWAVQARYSSENADLELMIDPRIACEGYRIDRVGSKIIRICGGDASGLFYGAGRFLRQVDSRGVPDIPENGIHSTPDKRIRGTYFATHFHNYYQDAPLEEVYDYIEDLLLWGCNTLFFWFDMHEYAGMQDPSALKMTERLLGINAYAKSLNMKTGLIYTANEYDSRSPVSLRATSRSEGTPYRSNLAAHYHIELCPSNEEGLALILKARAEMLAAFQSSDIDYFIIWPYDPGGCTCTKCYPWGSNGFIKLAKHLSRLTRSYFPRVKIILSAWLFDHFTEGEWEGLYRELEEDHTFCDYLLAEFMQKIPERIERGDMPGGLPLVGFPEISMHGAVPWGGFGINAYPQRIGEKWSFVKHLCEGGLLYSEGLFEDFNKAVHLQLYWGETDVWAASNNYCAYEFSRETADRITRLLFGMEQTLPRRRVNKKGDIEDYPDTRIKTESLPFFRLQNPDPAADIEEEAGAIENLLPEKVRNSWRWRIIRLRSIIDRRLVESGFRLTDELDACFAELRRIYYADNAYYCVSPPEKQSIFENRGGFTWD